MSEQQYVVIYEKEKERRENRSSECLRLENERKKSEFRCPGGSLYTPEEGNSPLDSPSGAIIMARLPMKSCPSIPFEREGSIVVGSRAVVKKKILEDGLACWAYNFFVSSPIRLCCIGLDRGICWGSILTHPGRPQLAIRLGLILQAQVVHLFDSFGPNRFTRN
ncbi:OLC1v1023776C1 [Oldenlandia corymbosa var. corymbosa]|uniref:OLC1v1023776C1 n=1 Tax=Oldenlandia corymbosa var. corymbosa TaxID=529605 RepID=A0AAV1C191_OLDCO|nr:OLC1v1023776C1 [Oldenlandia corymbosa var. corymbosa]